VWLVSHSMSLYAQHHQISQPLQSSLKRRRMLECQYRVASIIVWKAAPPDILALAVETTGLRTKRPTQTKTVEKSRETLASPVTAPAASHSPPPQVVVTPFLEATSSVDNEQAEPENLTLPGNMLPAAHTPQPVTVFTVTTPEFTPLEGPADDLSTPLPFPAWTLSSDEDENLDSEPPVPALQPAEELRDAPPLPVGSPPEELASGPEILNSVSGPSSPGNAMGQGEPQAIKTENLSNVIELSSDEEDASQLVATPASLTKGHHDVLADQLRLAQSVINQQRAHISKLKAERMSLLR